MRQNSVQRELQVKIKDKEEECKISDSKRRVCSFVLFEMGHWLAPNHQSRWMALDVSKEGRATLLEYVNVHITSYILCNYLNFQRV